MEYTHRQKRRALLHLLSESLDIVQEQYGEAHLVMEYKNRDNESSLTVYRTHQDVAEELKVSGAEAISLLTELADDGHLRIDYGRHGRLLSIGQLTVRITGSGRAEMRTPIPASQQELSAIRERLQQRGFGVALNHLNQAESAFERAEWEAANSQIRSCIEEVFNQVAVIKLETKKSGGEARRELELRGLLSKKEARLVQAAFPVAGEEGSHPGISNEEAARGRFLVGLGACYIGLSLL